MTTALQPGVTTSALSTAGGASPDPNATPSIQPSDNENPAIPHPAYLRMQPRWTKCRALMLGSEAIRADEEETFLPRFENESDDSYAMRANLAALFNGFSRVVNAATGMLLQQEPVLGEDMPPELVALWENIDGTGTHGAVFCADLVKNGIVDGHDGILVDVANPDATTLDRSKASAAAVPGQQLSADDEQRIGLRPYFILVKADSVIKPLYQTVDGVRTLVLLVVRENIDRRVGSFGVIGVTRYRVYTNQNGVINYQLWEVPYGAQRPALVEGPSLVRNVKKIPWSPLVAGRRLSPVEVVPPLMDLAELNIEHHQTKTNLLNLETLACVPTQVRIGASPDANGDYPPIVLGPRSTIEAPHIEGVQKPVYWHAPDISVLAPAQKTLEATEAAMGAMGMAFLAPQTRQTETAQAKRIDATAQNATISTVGRALQDCLEGAFGFAADFMGVAHGSVAVNNDFENLVMDAATMVAYVTAVEKAGLPARVMIMAWQAQGRIPDDIDPDDLLAEMMVNAKAIADQKEAEAQLAAERLKSGVPPVNPPTPEPAPAPVAA